MDDRRETNRRSWEERARLHAKSAFYDVDGFIAAKNGLWLNPVEPAELGDVRGKSLVHLQCHLGVETLSWARLGAARVVGLDFSAEAIGVARSIAERCGLADRATFVESDVYDAPRTLAGLAPFDVVYVSVGAVAWLPQIARWADVVAGLLAPGGVLYMREAHPMLGTVTERDGELVVDSPYFETRDGIRLDWPTDYADPNTPLENATTFEWNHGLGEIVQSLLDRAMTLELLREHQEAEWQAFTTMEKGPDDLYRLPEAQRPHVPLTFSLRARKRPDAVESRV